MEIEQKQLKKMSDMELRAALLEDPEPDYAAAFESELRGRAENGWMEPDEEFPQVVKPQADAIRQNTKGGFHLLRWGRTHGLREVEAGVVVTNITPTDEFGILDYTVTFTYRGRTCIRPYFDTHENQQPTVPTLPPNQ